MAVCSCCAVLSVTWRVVATGAPAVIRRCPRCDRLRPFGSSGRFRVNASGRRLDVWLVYRCVDCSTTWNRPIHDRVDPAALGPDLERYLANDRALARVVAATPERRLSLDAAGAAAAIVGPASTPVVATLVVAQPVTTRLDRLLAAHLGVPRSAVSALVDDARRLRRPPRDGDVVRVGGCQRRR